MQYFNNNTPATYSSDTKRIQCRGNRNRIIGDLKALLDGNFKTTTSINKTILLLLALLEQKKIGCLFCGTVEKLVFFNKEKDYYTFYVKELERGRNYRPSRKGTDNYCFNDLLKIYDNQNKI